MQHNSCTLFDCKEVQLILFKIHLDNFQKNIEKVDLVEIKSDDDEIEKEEYIELKRDEPEVERLENSGLIKEKQIGKKRRKELLEYDDRQRMLRLGTPARFNSRTDFFSKSEKYFINFDLNMLNGPMLYSINYTLTTGWLKFGHTILFKEVPHAIQ